MRIIKYYNMLNIIYKYILNFNINLDKEEKLDILFKRLCDKFSSDSSNEITSIKFILYDRFGYNPMERTEHIKKLCEQRQGQNEFRKKIILRDKKCLITGDNHEICEAAHIIPYSESGTFDIANGLLLNRCLHTMFDKYLWTINLMGCIVFSDRIYNHDNFHNYKNYNGKKINIDLESKKYLFTHYEKFLEFKKIL